MCESAVTVAWQSAVSVDLHREIVAKAALLSQNAFTGWQDCSIAYNSLTVFYDPWQVKQTYQATPGDFVFGWLEEQLPAHRTGNGGGKRTPDPCLL
ncbi:MAG: carboxyltransferase domain-containing protein [Flavihumibacter sp.]